MRKNENICCLDADLAKANGTINLREEFPDRAFDVGIAEQNMASVAAGLASYGFVPFIGSFTPFVTRRICDQMAISIAYAKQPVKIVGSDPGVSAELNGGTHMSFEDVAVVRGIPGMVVFEPVDAVQLAKALPQIVDYDAPSISACSAKRRPSYSATTTSSICSMPTISVKAATCRCLRPAFWCRKRSKRVSCSGKRAFSGTDQHPHDQAARRRRRSSFHPEDRRGRRL
jgi:deoxyxylulose-5-phosphate synthase